MVVQGAAACNFHTLAPVPDPAKHVSTLLSAEGLELAANQGRWLWWTVQAFATTFPLAQKEWLERKAMFVPGSVRGRHDTRKEWSQSCSFIYISIYCTSITWHLPLPFPFATNNNKPCQEFKMCWWRQWWNSFESLFVFENLTFPLKVQYKDVFCASHF